MRYTAQLKDPSERGPLLSDEGKQIFGGLGALQGAHALGVRTPRLLEAARAKAEEELSQAGRRSQVFEEAAEHLDPGTASAGRRYFNEGAEHAAAALHGATQRTKFKSLLRAGAVPLGLFGAYTAGKGLRDHYFTDAAKTASMTLQFDTPEEARSHVVHRNLAGLAGGLAGGFVGGAAAGKRFGMPGALVGGALGGMAGAIPGKIIADVAHDVPQRTGAAYTGTMGRLENAGGGGFKFAAATFTCPDCGTADYTRMERRFNGNKLCVNGHDNPAHAWLRKTAELSTYDSGLSGLDEFLAFAKNDAEARGDASTTEDDLVTSWQHRQHELERAPGWGSSTPLEGGNAGTTQIQAGLPSDTMV